MAIGFSTKQTLVQEFRGFKTAINVVCLGSGDPLGVVFREMPELLFYLRRYSFRTGGFGFDKRVTYQIEYENTDVPFEEIFRVDGESDIEYRLHEAIGSHRSKLVLCVPDSVDACRVYADFSVSYGGFYSNLTETSYQTKSFDSSRFSFVVFDFRYRIGRVKLNMMEKALKDEIARLKPKLFLPEMSREVKAYLAHNYLARTVSFWDKDDANPLERSYMQSAYGALINHRCVCQGYAEAYKRLLDSQGILCYVICGKIKGSPSHHAWNAISFDGRTFYHVDVTWDSHKGSIGWDYFCKSDRQLSSTRIWTRRPGVVCASEDNVLAAVHRQIAGLKPTYLSKGIRKEFL